MCNFLEGGKQWGPDTKIIYRQYATLFFVFWVDSSESELGILDLIHVFVETLDNCFESVCELDIIFNMDKVHYILQEIVMGGKNMKERGEEGEEREEEKRERERREMIRIVLKSEGMVIETDVSKILQAYRDQSEISKSENKFKAGMEDVFNSLKRVGTGK
jgi:hypothetical protein